MRKSTYAKNFAFFRNASRYPPLLRRKRASAAMRNVSTVS
jgi:hypothetical protein